MLNNAVYTPGIPDTHTGQYTVTMLTNTGSERYIFRFSTEDGAAYYTDEQGVTRRTADDSADYFLNSPYSFELYPQSTPPVLESANTELIIPNKLEWSYLTKDGIADLQQIRVTDRIETYSIANDVKFTFSIPPSGCKLTIRNGDRVVYTGSDVGNISLSSTELTQGNVLDFEIEVFYDQDSRLNYYGQATYRFRMNVVEAAKFFLNGVSAEEATIHTEAFGNYFLLTCQNVNLEQNLKISAEPALKSDAIVFKRGDTVYAAIPADTVCVDTLRTLKVDYGTAHGEFQLQITPRSGNTFTNPTSLRGDWQWLLGSGLEGRIATTGALSDSGFFTPQSSFGLPGSSATPTFTFGDRLTVSGTAIDDTMIPFELYEMSGAVSALSAGYVLDVCTDENDPLGRYVIVDHGGGLYTWYCGLSEIHMRVGDYVRVGDTVGIAGQTGLGITDKDCVLSLATWGKTAIAPQALRKD